MDFFGRATFGPSVSPDGTAFAHLVMVDGYPQAVQRYFTGSRVTASRYVHLPVLGPVRKVMHSPDGHWLACQIDPEGNGRFQVWVVTTDPSDPKAWRINEAGDASAELVGWDGTRVAITVEGEQCVGESRLVDPATHEVEVVDARYGARFIDSWAGSHLIRVGPRTDRSMFLTRGVVDRPLLPTDRGSTTDPGVILDDHKPLRLWYPETDSDLFRPAHLIEPWESDGYVRVICRSDHDADWFRLLMVTLTRGGASRRVLAERDDADLDAFAVSTDGSTAALLWNVRGGFSELQFLTVSDGTLHDPVPLPGPVASEPSLSADGSVLALTVEGPGMLPRVELWSRETSTWLEISDRKRTPGAVEPSFERIRAADGLELNGWLHRAPGVDGPGPVAVWFHGGPEGQARPDYSYVFPTLLEAGITVFAPNVRGSSGFGRAYRHADDLAQRFEGITDGLDIARALIDRGIADPSRIAATGRSYGGYLTNALIAFHPGVFTAAVAVCGMSDLRTFYAHTEPWIGAAAVSKYGHPELHADLLAALSPMSRVADIDVPLLAIHGANDTNVPVGESEQIVAALRARGHRAHCVVVPGEGHDFSQPANRRLQAELIRDWLLECWSVPVRRLPERVMLG